MQNFPQPVLMQGDKQEQLLSAGCTSLTLRVLKSMKQEQQRKLEKRPAVENESQVQGELRDPARLLTVALAGNPNSGKTTVFNSLTGGNQKTGNYAGVTIEKKSGKFKTPRGLVVNIIDLPGLYSLSAGSPEENIAQEILLGVREDTRAVDLAIVVVDATNIERNLYLATQIRETGVPVVILLNMIDVARERGFSIDVRKMSLRMDTPVIETSAVSGEGIDKVRDVIDEHLLLHSCDRKWRFDHETEKIIARAAEIVQGSLKSAGCSADWLARRALFEDSAISLPADVERQLAELRSSTGKSCDDLLDDEIVNRYRWIRRIYQETVHREKREELSKSERADTVLLHWFFGPLIFLIIMSLMFQAVYTWSEVPMGWIESGVSALSGFVDSAMPAGELKDLLLDGIIAGVGNVMIFLPQIVILFFFIALLEDTGYLARAAFLLDKMMGRVGLNGHAFIPLLSSFACAIPAILATRTIRSSQDRFVVIMIAPLMTCAARLPVYTLLIGAFFPATQIFGFISLRGLIMVSLYAGGVLGAFVVAWLLRRFIFKGERSPLILEIPSYKMPVARNIWQTIWNSSWEFIQRAGTIILLLTIVLWYLITHPAVPAEEGREIAPMEQVRQSYLGAVGQAIEPVIEPLGYDWKIGVGIISAFAAREVIVGTMAIIYSAGSEGEVSGLDDALRSDTDPRTGKKVWSPLVAASLLTFFVFTCMCSSTLAVIRKETNSWKWPAVVFAYTLILGYLGALLVYQGGKLFGL